MRAFLALASLALAVVAQAGDEPARPTSRGPAQVDANGDGLVTREEAQAHPRLSAQFDSADTDKDGRLDTAERNAHRELMRSEMRERAEERWKAADADGDGALSRQEAQQSMPGIAERFEKFDGNGDGKIARDEMHNFRVKNKRRGAGSEQL
jgi:hypothetical protein